jgi:hypothetical protein
VSGKLAPDTAKPVPVTVADVTTAAAVPVDDRVTDCVAVEYITTPPNEMLVALTLSVPEPAAKTGESCSANVALELPDVAVSVAVCEALTAETVAVNPALVAPAGTAALAGTVTAALLLASWMLMPSAGAAAVRLTVHTSVPAPLMEVWMHEMAFSVDAAAIPVPLRFTTRLPCEELLAIVRAPVAEPACCAENRTLSVAVCPGFSVSGKLVPDTAKPVPVTVADVTVTAAPPVDDRVTACVAVEPSTTPPNDTLGALTLSVAEPALEPGTSCSATVAPAVPDVAVRVAVCEALTGETVAVNPALAEAAGTVTVDGTITAELLLESLRVVLLLAIPFRVIVQESVAAPATVVLAQLRLEGVGVVEFARTVSPPQPAKARQPAAPATTRTASFDVELPLFDDPTKDEENE